MTGIAEFMVVLLTGFGFNLIPFAGPSNVFIAGNAALLLGTSDPWTLIAVGFLVAIGASLAKGVHYLVTFFIGKHIKGRQRERLDQDAVKIRRWAFWLLFAAAATPIPDEPVVYPLGLMKYSPPKFFTAYFLGKIVITIPGAFLWAWGGGALSEWFSPMVSVVLSILLTVVVTVVLLKMDIGKMADDIAQKYFKKKTQQAA